MRTNKLVLLVRHFFGRGFNTQPLGEQDESKPKRARAELKAITKSSEYITKANFPL